MMMDHEPTAIALEPARHHRLLIERLEAVERGEIDRLMVLMPPGSAKSILIIAAQPPPAIPAQDDSDEHLIRLWLHSRPPSTLRAYTADVRACLHHVGKPLRQVTLGDLQAYRDSLATFATASQARKLSVVKSLLSFGQRCGYLTVNIGAAVQPPKIKQTLAERILDENAVQQMLALERQPRNRAMLRLLYLGGLRVSELCQLRGRDLQAREDTGQVTVFGKGGQTRAILLKRSIWTELAQLRADDPDAPVFRSREGGGQLDPSQVHRIVKTAARRAGLSAAVSAHWLRHAHLSHALDRGAPAHLVQQTVGHASLATTSRYAHARPSDSSSTYLPG